MLDMPAWPPRPAICLDCRTLQPAADRCLASAHHRLADLTAPAGRAALLERAWGSPSVRRRIRTAAKVGSTGGATGGGLEACSGCDGCGVIEAGGSVGEIVAVILVVAFVFVAIYLLAIGVRALWRWWRRPPPVRPNGAEARGLAVGRFAGRTGTVVARATAPAAIGDAPCVAYALQASYRDRGERVMLRDSVGVGFEVVLDDGAVVEIPAGPVALDVDGAPARPVAPTFAAHLDVIDPQRRGADDLDPFAATHVRQVVLADGDRVEVRGRLRPMPSAATGAAYRGVTSERWIAEGVPQLIRAS